MKYSSWHFIGIFLPIAIIGFASIPARYAWLRKAWLIIASLCFYDYWRIEYLPLIILSIVANYGISELVYQYHNSSLCRYILGLGVAANIILLGYFK